jgi:hypothetical protein
MPDKGTLVNALQSYKAVFTRASGKKSDCKNAFSGAFGGRLKDFTQWCDVAKSFAVSEQCGGPDGTAEAPIMTCTETVVVKTSEGTPPFPQKQKTFRFAKGSDGNWQVAGW